MLHPDLFHRKSQAVYNLQMFALVAEFSQCVLPVEGWGKICSKACDTISHNPRPHGCILFFAFHWQTLKGVLIHGLLIVLRSIQPSAEKKGVTSLAVSHGISGATAKPSAWLLLCLRTASSEGSSVVACQPVVLCACCVSPLFLG